MEEGWSWSCFPFGKKQGTCVCGMVWQGSHYGGLPEDYMQNWQEKRERQDQYDSRAWHGMDRCIMNDEIDLLFFIFPHHSFPFILDEAIYVCM